MHTTSGGTSPFTDTRPHALVHNIRCIGWGIQMMFVDWAKTLTVMFASIAVLAGCAPGRSDSNESLMGAWRSQVQFTSGPFATVRDLEFMYVVHADGTLTESSNYDAAPPVPPAYGVWRETSPTPELMHATDTIDYLIILSGKVTLVLEEGEADLGPGDFVVDRGVVHGWRNPHDEPCV